MTFPLSSLSVVFAGTPDFSAAHLNALNDANIAIKAVYCQPDRPKGRGKKLVPPATKVLAQSIGIDVYQPLNFKSEEAVNELAALKPDLMIVVAYGLILPETVLSIPRYGCINVHASTLPRWRGAAPIERAIEAGDDKTGVTIMQMEAGLDTGPILNHESIPVTQQTTGDNLRETMQMVGSNLLIATLERLASQQLQPIIQDDNKATYAKKLLKEEARIHWSLPAEHIAAKIRAFNSSNVCFSFINNERIKVWQADVLTQSATQPPGTIITISKEGIDVTCIDAVLRLTVLQLPNGKPLSVQALLNGNKSTFTQGACFD